MDIERTRKKWTEENINYLKTAYLLGLPLKQIAAKSGRSVSAINKILDRYKLRTHSRMVRFPSFTRLTAYQLQQTQNLGVQTRKKNKEQRPNILSNYREWVPFEYVIRWMKEEGMSVIKSEFDTYYEIDGYPKNKAQILSIANSRRNQLQLPIFLVEGITCP